MGVIDGQAVSAAITNPAFLDATEDDTGTGKYTLANTDPASGSTVDNLQREHNSSASFTGKALNSAKDDLPAWTHLEVGTAFDPLFERTDALTERFSGSTGHIHDGSDGEGAQIDAVNIANVPLKGYVQQGTTFSATGASGNVSSYLSLKTPGGSTSSEGVVTAAPNNKVVLRQGSGANEDDEIVDASGNVVYGRLTYATGVWTLSYYSLVSGTETTYSFGGSTSIKWYYQEIFNPLGGNAPVFSEFATIPSDNATADVITATTTLQGKVLLSSSAPGAIASTGSAGTATASVANADHTHAGVHSVAKSGSTQILGDVTFTASAGVTLTQASSNIDISAPALTSTTPSAIAATSAVGTATTSARADHTHEGTHSVVLSGETPIKGDVTIAVSGGTTGSQLGSTITISSPPLSSTAAAEIGSTASAGTGTNSAREDHVHRGMHSLSKSGSSQLFGDVTLSQGTNITLTQSSQDIQIATTAANVTSSTPSDVAATAAVGTATDAARADHVHKGAASVGLQGGTKLYGDVAVRASTVTGSIATVSIDSPNNAIVIGTTPFAGTGRVQSVGSANAAGTDTTPIRSDHVHQGVHSVAKNGSAALYGDVTFSEGTNVTLTQVGNDISIATSLTPSSSTPQDVGASGSSGVATDVSRSDHVHKGVHSVAKSGGTQLFGDVAIAEGTNVSITQVGNTLTIASTAGGASPSSSTPQDVAATGAVGTSTDYARGDHAHKGVHSVAKSGSAALYGDVTLSAGVGVTLTQSSNDISIATISNAVITPGSYPVTLDSTYDGKTLLIDTSATRTINAFAASANFSVTIKDKTGTAGTYAISFVPSGAQKVEGLATTYSMQANFGTWHLSFDGTDWWVI